MVRTGSTILDETRVLFLRHGIKSMTMDDVAAGLGVSKKTLYQHVSNKSDLVKKVIDLECRTQESKIDKIRGEDHNAIRESFEIGRSLIALLREMHPSIHYDLEKYYPEAWNLFLEFKTERVIDKVLENLRKGIQEGSYRKDFDPEVIGRIYTYRIDAVFHGELFPPDRFSFAEVYVEMFFYHMLGIASEKGRELLYKEWEEGRMDMQNRTS